ncbi:MAG: glycosyltransferase family 4 protein [Deltaproteobacteria bacterium]|nr:glycosyltransferase family 4 protein [Deltaproteobacteria bacterium]
MKIAVVIPKYGLVGGAEGFAYELTERLAVRDCFDIHVFANQYRRGEAPIVFHKLPILPFPRFIRHISFARSAERKLRQDRFDLIHSHDRIFRTDLLTMHGIPHERWIKNARKKRLTLFDKSMTWVEKRGLTGPTLRMVLPVSELVKDELRKVYAIPEHRMRVIHPGISKERFTLPKRDACRKQVRSRHGLSPSDVVILFVGMNFEIKRLALVLEALAELVQKEKAAFTLKLLVVGKGDRHAYRTLARRLGIEKQIIFAGVTHEVESYYLAADIFVMPSIFDTFGMAVLEAMAAGLPVIITPKVGARDLVTEGLHGFILQENPQPAELAAKIGLLLDPRRRSKMGEAARTMALQHTWDRAADEMEAVYRIQR